MRYTHAIVVRIPNTAKFDDKKTASKTDLSIARKQQEDLNDTLREAGLDVIELNSDENVSIHSLFADDIAVVINGTALITKPKKPGARREEIATLLKDLVWQVVDSPETEHGKSVVLEGSDVLYTGKEIFVGLRKNGTNMEGVYVLGRTFPDTSVVPIELKGNLPLKYYVSVAANEVLTVSKGKESQHILRKIERDATYRYKVLTLEQEDAVNCINVNEHVIFRHDVNELKYRVLQQPIELWGITAGELTKIGTPVTKFCLLVRKVQSKGTLV